MLVPTAPTPSSNLTLMMVSPGYRELSVSGSEVVGEAHASMQASKHVPTDMVKYPSASL